MSLETQTERLMSCFPEIWGGDASTMPGGGLYALFDGIGTLHDMIDQQITYTKNQTRLLTSTDNNVESFAAEFLGDFPRSRNGPNLDPELDSQYAARIQAAVIEEQITLKGVQERITQYLVSNYSVDYTLGQALLGLDTEGSLDGWGALDGRPKSTPPIPAVTVFDVQSNPELSAIVGLTDYQFCVLLTYGGITQEGFFLDYSYLDEDTYLIEPGYNSVSPLTDDFAAYVNSIRALGTTPVYADNRSA